MQENKVEQPPSLSQLLRESYLSEARAQQRHSEMSRSDGSSSRLQIYGSLKGKAEDGMGQNDPQLPDLSAFLSQEELDKSVNLARQAIGHETREERVEVKASVAPLTPSGISPVSVSSATPSAIPFSNTSPAPSAAPSAGPLPLPDTEFKKTPDTQTEFTPSRKLHKVPIQQDNMIRNSRESSEGFNECNRPARNTPYGPETQSKKEFLNKAADFIEELSSLFKANSSKRVRPRSCKAHRSRSQNKSQSDGTVYPPSPDNRERSLMPVEVEKEGTSPAVSHQPVVQPDPGTGQAELQGSRITEVQQYETASPEAEEKAEGFASTEPQFSTEPVCEPPHFIQKLKSREVLEGSKVQLDCIVRGLPIPEVRWFCEGKELENSPDIQIITNGELHSLVIAEAFEEDTGRYSCFASNFYGTDSTSAEIYVEGVSSSDSEGEQHLEHVAQPHRKQPKLSSSLPRSLGQDLPAEKQEEEESYSVPSQPAPETETQTEQISSPTITQTTSETLSPVRTPAAVLSVPELEQAATAPPAQTETALLPPQVFPTSSGETEFRDTDQESTPVEVTSTPQLATASPTTFNSVVLPAQPAAAHSAQPESQISNHSYPQGNNGQLIMAAPVFTKSLQDLITSESQLVVLECRVKGVPSPRVDWYREGKIIEDSPDFRILQKKPRSPAESEEICTLVIAEVFPEDSGMFTCTANNKYGTVSSTATLRVKANVSNSNHTRPFGSLTIEPSQIQEFSPSVPVVSPQPEVSVTNNLKPHSSTIRLDPLVPSNLRLDPLNTSTLRLDPLSSSMLRPDPLRSSLPNLEPTSLNSHKTPTVDPVSLKQEPNGSNGAHPEPQRHFLSYPKPFVPSAAAVESSAEHSRPSVTSPDMSTKVKATSNHQNGSPVVVPLPDPPPNSCLKNGTMTNHKDRVGLRVHFKLPEDEEEEQNNVSYYSDEDVTQASFNKEPPPVLAKPKLDPAQLQLLHNQVLLEQQQETEPQTQTSVQPPSQPASQSQPSSRPPFQTQSIQPPSQPTSQPASQPLFQTQNIQPPSQPTSQPTSQPKPPFKPPFQTQNTQPPTQPTSQPLFQTQNVQSPSQPLSQTPFQTQSKPVVQSSQEGPLWSPRMHRESHAFPFQSQVSTTVQITQPAPPVSTVPPPAPTLTSPAPSNIFSPLLNTSAPPPFSSTPSIPQQLKTSPLVTSPPPAPQLYTPPSLSTSSITQINTIHASHLNLSPAAHAGAAPTAQFSSPPAPKLSTVATNPTPTFQEVISPAPLLRSTHASLMNLTAISSTFSYTRPKEFITAQTLSPVRSPSPTESPVPLLHELAAELNSPASSSPTLPPFSPPPRTFPTRVLMSPTSPPSLVSSPTPGSAPFLNSVFAFRAQSPPQASSPTSSSSTPSPIQNPVAFLSSVLPSLTPSQPTNSMGLPKRAPVGLQKKVAKVRVPSIEDIRDSKELLLHDIEKKLRFKDDTQQFAHQQKLSNEGKTAIRPLGPNIPATVINYDEEYRVSNFEQRLMSEIEFRLERTPVEESDDEVQHDDVPTGKCIAPLFDKKLKNFRAMEGVPVTFSCKLVGIPVPKVYWFKDGKQILRKNVHYKKIREGDGTCALHIECTTNDDDGNYTIMAANPQGRISCSGHLIVQTGPPRNRQQPIHSQRVRARIQEVEGEQTQERFFRPHFLQAPGDMMAHEGRMCRLDCKVSGLPNPELMWLVNGKPIYSDLYHKMMVRENGVHSLVIDPLMQKDAGTYTCIASNKAGQSSFSLDLKVVEKEMKHPPQFVEKLQNMGIPEGTPVRLECRVVGMPPPVIFWKKDNETIPTTKDRISMTQDATGYVCLLIQPTRKEDAGWYTVSAKNEAGIVSCTSRLDIYAQWHQNIPSPMKKTPRTGSRYAALTGQGLDIKSIFPTADTSPILFSSSPPEARLESEEL